MQITKKEQKSATYDVACVGNKYAITGAVVVRNGEVKTMESCVITRDSNSLFVANFSQYGEDVALTDAQKAEIRAMTASYPYVYRQAIEKELK